MNREIKFKIYDKNDTEGVIGPFQWNKLPNFLYPDNFTLLQYTGLKDKNGKEIYEGDICKNRFGNLEEFWIAEPLNVRVRIYNDGIYNRYPNSHESDYYEIVGNIYQHPELLKQND